jgi:hypothetical protein
MKRKTLFAIGLVAATIAGSVAFAHGPGGFGGAGPTDGGGMMGGGMMGGMGGQGGMMGGQGQTGDMGDMMQMMMRMHGQMMGGAGTGPMGFGMMGGAFDGAFDADGDGTVKPEELRTGLEAQLAGNDSNGDGALSLDEFETLHSAMIRSLMVDRFQAFDEDGDGRITAEEIAAPAVRLERMQALRGQATGNPGDAMPMDQGAGAGTMMNGN